MREFLAIIFGISSGAIVSGGVFAFITALGIVPKMAKKTKTQSSIIKYENFIILGGLFGCLTMVFDFSLPIGLFSIIIFLLNGVFVGTLALCLAEVLDVLPILNARLNVKKGLTYFVFAIAFGKITGSLIYFIKGGFQK